MQTQLFYFNSNFLPFQFRKPMYYALQRGRLTVPKESMKVPPPWQYDYSRWPMSKQESRKKECNTSERYPIPLFTSYILYLWCDGL